MTIDELAAAVDFATDRLDEAIAAQNAPATSWHLAACTGAGTCQCGVPHFVGVDLTERLRLLSWARQQPLETLEHVAVSLSWAYHDHPDWRDAWLPR